MFNMYSLKYVQTNLIKHVEHLEKNTNLNDALFHLLRETQRHLHYYFFVGTDRKRYSLRLNKRRIKKTRSFRCVNVPWNNETRYSWVLSDTTLEYIIWLKITLFFISSCFLFCFLTVRLHFMFTTTFLKQSWFWNWDGII